MRTIAHLSGNPHRLNILFRLDAARALRVKGAVDLKLTAALP